MILITLFLILFGGQHHEAEQFVQIEIDRAAAIKFLNGECIPPMIRHEDGAPIVRLIIRKDDQTNRQEWTNALVLALGHVPQQHSIELDDPIPIDFEHVDIIPHHNSHPPFRPTQSISRRVSLVKFCEPR